MLYKVSLNIVLAEKGLNCSLNKEHTENVLFKGRDTAGHI